MLDANRIRADFPLLKRLVTMASLWSTDNAATAQKPEVVLNALDDYYHRYNANIHRGLHTLAERSTEAFEKSRHRVAKFIGATEPEEIIFTKGATESINLVAATWGEQNISSGDEIIISELEHHANFVPWIMLAQRQDRFLKYAVTDVKQH